MKFAILGKGFIYPRHLNAIKEIGGEVVMTCDIDLEKDPDYTDWKFMFDSEAFKDVDVVSVCTPNYTHSEIVVEALKRGKKVICEKPLCIDSHDLKFLEGVNTVLQLRYNPEVKALKERLGDKNKVSITIKTYREEAYWQSWKGDPAKSGGILYNMGVHYIDLLGYLLGKPLEVRHALSTRRLAIGEVEFEKGVGKYHIELLSEKEDTIREIVVNGETMELEGATIPLSDRDGKRQDLHTEVYKSFMKGEGIPLSEARKSLELVANLYEANGK